MQAFVINIMKRFGYWGISFLIAIENIFPPIPSEIILTFGGFMTTSANLNVWLMILFATIGSTVGTLALYLLGRILKVERLERLFAGKFGRVMHLKSEDVAKANKWFSKHGKKAVFFCRFVPIVRSLISIPAGIAGMKLIIFLPLTVIGTLIWNTVLIFLGRAAGNAWERIAGYFDLYSTIALVVICAIILVVAIIFIKKRFLNRSDKAVETETDSESAGIVGDETEVTTEVAVETEETNIESNNSVKEL